MIMRHIRRVVIHVPRVVFYLRLQLRLLLLCKIVILLYLRFLLLCRIVILVPRLFFYLRLQLGLLLCRVVILVPRIFFYLRLQLGLLLLLSSPICSFFGNVSGIIVVVSRLLCDISLLWVPWVLLGFLLLEPLLMLLRQFRTFLVQFNIQVSGILHRMALPHVLIHSP
jgi:hypothetical protein